MFWRRKELDPLDWCFVLNLYGFPLKYNLETGIRYRLKGLLSPGSGLRIIDEHGDFVFAAEARSDHTWFLNQPFTMEKEMGSFVTLQFCGEAENLHFTIDGVNMEHFK